MSRITEQKAVQDQHVNYFNGCGWQYLPPVASLAARDNDESNTFLTGVLREQLAALNPNWLSETQIDESVRRLRIVSAIAAMNF